MGHLRSPGLPGFSANGHQGSVSGPSFFGFLVRGKMMILKGQQWRNNCCCWRMAQQTLEDAEMLDRATVLENQASARGATGRYRIFTHCTCMNLLYYTLGSVLLVLFPIVILSLEKNSNCHLYSNVSIFLVHFLVNTLFAHSYSPFPFSISIQILLVPSWCPWAIIVISGLTGIGIFASWGMLLNISGFIFWVQVMYEAACLASM